MTSTLFLISALLAGSAAGQVAKSERESTADTGRAQDVAAILASDAAFTKAFNAGDAKALAATFTTDAEMIDEDDEVVEGREEIEARFAAGFAEFKGATITLESESIRFLSAETALVRGRSVISTPEGLVEPTRYTVVFVKQEGKWLQASVRDEYDNTVKPHERLKELEWLLGEWVNESDDAVVFTSCTWSPDKNYLIRNYTVQIAGRPAMSGTQRIGWDPLTRQFKSWVFDSEGGYGEGYMVRDAERWVIKAVGVRADGRHDTATQVLTRVNKDMVRWKSIDRSSSGRIAPDIAEFVLVRKPPKPR